MKIGAPLRKTSRLEPAVGVDIGNHSVKVCQIHKDGDRFRISGIGYSEIDVLNPKGTVEAIKSACRQAAISVKKVNASVFPEGVIVRYLLLPLMSEEELRRAMSFEIERYVPFDSEQGISDYQVLKVDEEKKNIKVLMVAAKKELVDSRLRLLQEAGLEPQIITIDSMVLKNVFQENYPDKQNTTVGLLNIGARVTNINIIRENCCYFMRDVQIGGENITNLIKEKLEIDSSAAEQKKLSLSPRDQNAFKTIEPVLGNLLNEVYLSFDYYESEFGLVVDEVFLSGGTANLGWLVDFLTENLGRKISVLNPTQNLIVSPSVDAGLLTSKSASLVAVIGLALESFN